MHFVQFAKKALYRCILIISISESVNSFYEYLVCIYFESVCRDVQFRESTLCDVTNSPPNSLFAENAIVWIFFFFFRNRSLNKKAIDGFIVCPRTRINILGADPRMNPFNNDFFNGRCTQLRNPQTGTQHRVPWNVGTLRYEVSETLSRRACESASETSER